jgi:hypothetical protein
VEDVRVTAYSERHVAKQRLAQGYVTASQVPVNAETTGKRCGKCRHFGAVFRPRCHHGDFPVTKNATCARWVG